MALEKIEGVNKVMLSGMSAFVKVDDGTTLTRATVRKAFDPAGLKVEKVSKKEIPAPAEAYGIAVTGAT